MKVPNPETIRLSAIAHLRQLGSNEAADLLLRSKLEIGETGQRYAGSTKLGLNLTLRCKATELEKFEDQDSGLPWLTKSEIHTTIQEAIEAVLPAEIKVHDLSARSMLVDRNEFEKTEIERLIQAQMDLMTAVATGGPQIKSKNSEYKERRRQIREKLESIDKLDPNPFDDLWAWYGRWSSGDLPSYQSRRDYIRTLYRDLLETLVGTPANNVFEPNHEPTGWAKVDRAVDKMIANLDTATDAEDFQTLGLLCRECLISLAQAVYDPMKHKPLDDTEPSKTDACRMLEAYFSTEFPGAQNEALRHHSKASLKLANALQHKRTATRKEAALCSEATRTVVNIVAITSERH